MLAARIIRPAPSAWSFPMVIATKKDDNPRFFVDNRALNSRMEAYRFRYTTIEAWQEVRRRVGIGWSLDLTDSTGILDQSRSWWKLNDSENLVVRSGSLLDEQVPICGVGVRYEELMDSITLVAPRVWDNEGAELRVRDFPVTTSKYL